MTAYSSDVAFTPTVKALQEQRGSRSHYAKMEAKGGWRTAITADLAGLLAEARSFYLATANAEGQPYIQHRGGPPGFVRVIDERTLGFADFKGNRQYITTGNLADNPRAYIFVMDYAQRRRVKLWGRARVVENDDALLARLWPEGYQARPEQVILFEEWRDPSAMYAWTGPNPERARLLPGTEELIDDLEITHYEALDVDTGFD